MRSLFDQPLNVCSHWARPGGGPFGLMVVVVVVAAVVVLVLGPAIDCRELGTLESGEALLTLAENWLRLRLPLPLLPLPMELLELPTLSPGESLCCLVAEVHGSGSSDVRFLVAQPSGRS